MKRLQELAPYLQSWLPKLLGPLKAQISDLRSVSAREAGTTIQVLARTLDFENTAVKLIPTLVKQMQNGNKILAEVGNQALLGILLSIESPRIHSALQHEITISRSPFVHFKLAIYLYEICASQIDSLSQECAELFLKSTITS
jgi:hypothetical protein